MKKFSVDAVRLAQIEREGDRASGATLRAQERVNEAARRRFAAQQAVEQAQAQHRPVEALIELGAELDAAEAAFQQAQRELAGALEVRTHAMQLASRLKAFVERKSS
jgi:hypothetical protein